VNRKFSLPSSCLNATNPMNSFAGWLADDSFVHLLTSPRNVPLLLPATPSIFHNPVPPISKIRFYDTANQCTYMDSKKELQWVIFGDACVWDCRRFPSCCHSFTNDYSKVALKLGINQVSIRLPPFHYLFFLVGGPCLACCYRLLLIRGWLQVQWCTYGCRPDG
jgi:hypothetical protein